MNKPFAFDDLEIGMSAEITKVTADNDIRAFAALTGDDNPVHLDEDFAKTTRFGGRIAHGMLTASLISAVIGTRLPGPGCIYVEQVLRFKAPVRIGDEVTARVTVSGLIAEKKFVRLETLCLVGGKTVLEGEATVYVPARR